MGSTQQHINRGVVSITRSATGASAWRKLDGNYTQFGMQSIPSTATTAFSMELQGTLSTNSTTPTALIAVTALTGAAVATTEIIPVAFIRINSTDLSSGSVVNYVTALP